MQALAVGNDSGMCNADFASDAPCVIFPSIVGGYNMPGIMVQKDSYDRDEAQRERGVSVVNADNDCGMHKPGYPGDVVLCVVWVSVGVSGGLFFVFVMLSVLLSGSSKCQALWLAWTRKTQPIAHDADLVLRRCEPVFFVPVRLVTHDGYRDRLMWPCVAHCPIFEGYASRHAIHQLGP